MLSAEIPALGPWIASEHLRGPLQHIVSAKGKDDLSELSFASPHDDILVVRAHIQDRIRIDDERGETEAARY